MSDQESVVDPRIAPVSPEARAFYEREYGRIGDELLQNEAMGDSRVGSYLGIWTAAVGGVAAIATSNDTELRDALIPIIIAGLAVVFLFGAVTLARIVKRNYGTDRLIDSLARLRRLLGPEVSEWNPSALPWNDHEGEASLTKQRRPILLHAGLFHVVVLANAVVPALLIVGLERQETGWWQVSVALVGTLALQLGIVWACNKRALDKRRQRTAAFFAFESARLPGGRRGSP